MATLEILLFILFIVVIVTAIAENINIPYPILLVISGLLVGLIPNLPSWQPSSDIILPLFLPPILFSAARSISWHDIKKNILSIFFLAFLLVFLTAICIAFILNWTVQSFDLGTALLLGAIIAPTDIVAAQSILSKMHVEVPIIRTVQVESLFNDAVGIILYKASFILILNDAGIPTTIRYQWHPDMMLSGVLIGLFLAYIANLIIKNFLTSSENDLPIIIGIILAYVSYLFAEKLDASSVFAVVTAGLYYQKKTSHTIRASTRLAEKVVWDTLLFFLNGLIFISIGIAFPDYFKKIHYLPVSSIILFSLITISTIIGLRFLWICFTDLLNQLWKQRKKLSQRVIVLKWKSNLVITWSGMRGLVSMALALALPLNLSNGTPFPERDLIIILTISSILFTVIVQGLTLPLLIKLLNVRKNADEEIHKIRETYHHLTKVALNHIESFSHHPQINSLTVKHIVKNHYKSRLLGLDRPTLTDNDERKKQRACEQQAELLLARSLQFERDMLLRMRLQGEISEEVYIKVLQKLDRDEANFTPH